MNRHQWIDNLSTAMAARVPRRGLFGWARALTIGLVLDGAARTAVAKRRDKGAKGEDKNQWKGKDQLN